MKKGIEHTGFGTIDYYVATTKYFHDKREIEIGPISLCRSCVDFYQEQRTNQNKETDVSFMEVGKGKMICEYCKRETIETESIEKEQLKMQDIYFQLFPLFCFFFGLMFGLYLAS